VSTPAVAWVTAEDVTTGPCAGLSGDDADALNEQLLIATQLLYLRTGRQWPGVVTDSFRPNPGGCHCSYGRPGCTRVPEIQLPGYPVVAVASVMLDGELVSADTYRVDDKRYLVRLPNDDDLNEGWPCCQRMDWELSELDTFGIDYSWGANPDHAGMAACKRLGCEFHLAADPATAGACRLPMGVVRTISRQGVSIEIGEQLDLDHCGLPQVTMWLSALDAERAGSHRGGQIIDIATLARRGRRARRPSVPGS
jgi:hypothetical protein